MEAGVFWLDVVPREYTSLPSLDRGVEAEESRLLPCIMALPQLLRKENGLKLRKGAALCVGLKAKYLSRRFC